MDFATYTPTMMSLLKKLMETESPTYDIAGANRLGPFVVHSLVAAIEITFLQTND